MSPIALLLLIGCGIAILTVKRRSAPIPLLLGCCYMTIGQGLVIAGANLPVYRLLIILGFIRVMVRSERPVGGLNGIDKLIIGWSLWIFFASFFHDWTPGSGPKYASGVVLSVTGTYFLIRIFISDANEAMRLMGITCLLLAPIAIEMVSEQITNHNLFSAFGGIPETPIVRGGRIRAQGPFSHPILAGTIGATCLPFALAVWKRNKLVSLIGILACFFITVASASSGPILSFGAAMAAVFFFRYRHWCRKVQIAAVAAYGVLWVVMTDPPYYLLSRIDLTGSSTGWHRSFLIDRSIQFLNEWWLFGTDKTIHWMPRQGRISDIHTDITNYYLVIGVMAGLPAVLLMIQIMRKSFNRVGSVSTNNQLPTITHFSIWCLGASLFAHAATSISVSYFGQAQVFFWLPIAIIASIRESDLVRNEQDQTHEGTTHTYQ